MSDITVVTVQLDIALRERVDPAGVCACLLRKIGRNLVLADSLDYRFSPDFLLERFVCISIRKALPDAITPDAVFRYDPFRGLLAVRYGDKRGGDFVFGEPEGGWAQAIEKSGTAGVPA